MRKEDSFWRYLQKAKWLRSRSFALTCETWVEHGCKSSSGPGEELQDLMQSFRLKPPAGRTTRESAHAASMERRARERGVEVSQNPVLRSTIWLHCTFPQLQLLA